MRIRVGRNDPCPCGSGLKFKKCHIGRLEEALLARISKPEFAENQGLLTGRPFITTEFRGRKVVAVGSRLYPNLPPNITLHEFVITFLKDILGAEWGMAEQRKAIDEQHIVVRWIKEMGNLLKNSPNRLEDPIREIKSAEPSGNVQALLSLAYDVYSVYHCAELPDELINRLRTPDQFQGAKYEIAIAALFARAGFNIEWLVKSSSRICEFIATHKITKEQIIVEAKSRHRQGVLSRPGSIENPKRMKSQVGRLFNRALSKPTNGLPFMIFIDLNLPLTPGDNDLQKRWAREVRKMLEQHPKGTEKNPEKFTALFITNFSWHYHGEDTRLLKGESVTILPLYPEVRLKDPSLVDVLRQAINQYGLVPPLFPSQD